MEHQVEGMTTQYFPSQASPKPAACVQHAGRSIVTSLGSHIFTELSEHVVVAPHESGDGLIIGVDLTRAPSSLIDAAVGQVS